MKVRKISNLSVQISKFSKYDAEGAIISVPWKERKKDLESCYLENCISEFKKYQ